MNTMMTSDLENEADRVKREEEERAANAAALLAESTANSPGRGNSRRRSMKQQSPDKSRTQSSFRAAGGGNREPGSPVGSRRGTIADRMAKEMEAKGMQQWVVPCSSSNGRGESSSSSSTEEDGEKERGEVSKDPVATCADFFCRSPRDVHECSREWTINSEHALPSGKRKHHIHVAHEDHAYIDW